MIVDWSDLVVARWLASLFLVLAKLRLAREVRVIGGYFLN
jgi:hypothetical protein